MVLPRIMTMHIDKITYKVNEGESLCSFKSMTCIAFQSVKMFAIHNKIDNY